MLNCRELTHLVSLARERKPSWRERAGMALHLAICRGCRRFTRQLRLIRRAMHRSEYALVHMDDIRLSVHSRQRIRAALDNASR